MSFRLWAAFAAMCLCAPPAAAGPPYQTGRHGDLDGGASFDLNYGGFEEAQVTATLPGHSRIRRARAGRSVEAMWSVKYRFVKDEESGVQTAILFPRVILPTASNALDGERARLLMPLWIQKNWGGTSLFGGGGYEIIQAGDNTIFGKPASL